MNSALQFACASHFIHFDDEFHSFALAGLFLFTHNASHHLWHSNNDSIPIRETNCTHTCKCEPTLAAHLRSSKRAHNTRKVRTTCRTAHQPVLAIHFSFVRHPAVLIAACTPLNPPAFSLTACHRHPHPRCRPSALFLLLAASTVLQAASLLPLPCSVSACRTQSPAALETPKEGSPRQGEVRGGGLEGS